MNIYFLGMCISFLIYILIGLYISRKVRSADDYYVAGRRAPVALIAGSMIASYASTGMFMGDAAQCYEGAFSSLIILGTAQVAGYMIGAVFFGRYLRRSKVVTIPEYFGRRFCSPAVKMLATITAIITMIVYLLSVIQGIGTLMNAVTGFNYNLCLIIAMVVFTIVTVAGGSSGVLITDTLMAGIFTIALVLAIIAIASNSGGWFGAIGTLAANPETSQILSWGGRPGALYNSGIMNVIWGVVYGIVWFSVCMVGPWQSSRYLMARNEHTIIRSSVISAIGVFLLEFLSGMAAVMVNVNKPDLEDSSHVLIWAAMNLMPKVLGVILLTGVLAAGISSATTFLSLIGSSFANDVLKKQGKSAINTGRIVMIIASLIVLIIAVFNPPAIFWIMFFGGAIVASSWMPVALASVISKRVTKKGAFCGMLCGFLGCFVVRMFTALSGVELPVYLDPSIVGMVLNVIAMVIADRLGRVTDEERLAREAMFIVPDSEKEPKEVKKTLKFSGRSVLVGVFVIVVLLGLWVIPYLTSL